MGKRRISTQEKIEFEEGERDGLKFCRRVLDKTDKCVLEMKSSLAACYSWSEVLTRNHREMVKLAPAYQLKMLKTYLGSSDSYIII